MFKFSQNRLLFQWPSKYVRTVYQKYRENSGKNTGENTGTVYRKYRENSGKYRGKFQGKYRESHRNHSGEQIVIHQGRKSVTEQKLDIILENAEKCVG